MSDGTLKRWLLLDRSNVDVGVLGCFVSLIRNPVHDYIGYFTGLSINRDAVAFTDSRSGRKGNRCACTKIAQPHTGNVISVDSNINFVGVRHGITSFRRRGYAPPTPVPVPEEKKLEERVKELEDQNATMADQLTSTQMALCDVYEQVLSVASTTTE